MMLAPPPQELPSHYNPKLWATLISALGVNIPYCKPPLYLSRLFYFWGVNKGRFVSQSGDIQYGRVKTKTRLNVGKPINPLTFLKEQ